MSTKQLHCRVPEDVYDLVHQHAIGGHGIGSFITTCVREYLDKNIVKDLLKALRDEVQSKP